MTNSERSAASFGANAWLVDDMYEQYRQDPGSVSESWREFFQDYRPGGANLARPSTPEVTVEPDGSAEPEPQGEAGGPGTSPVGARRPAREAPDPGGRGIASTRGIAALLPIGGRGAIRAGRLRSGCRSGVPGVG